MSLKDHTIPDPVNVTEGALQSGHFGFSLPDEEVEVELERAIGVHGVEPQPEAPKAIGKNVRVSSNLRSPSELESNPFVHDISQGDMAESLAMVMQLSEGERLDDLQLAPGEEVNFTYTPPPGSGQAADGPQRMSVTETSELSGRSRWAAAFMTAAAATVKAVKRVQASLHQGARYLVISGKARNVGLARSAYASGLRNVGLDLSGWTGEYKKTQDVKLREILAGYGIETRKSDDHGVQITFDAIKKCPPEVRADVLRALVSTMAEDHQVLGKVAEDIKDSLRKKYMHQYRQIEKLSGRYVTVSEKALLALLETAAAIGKRDRNGELRKVLRESQSMAQPIEEVREGLKGGIRQAFKLAGRADPRYVAELEKELRRFGLSAEEIAFDAPAASMDDTLQPAASKQPATLAPGSTPESSVDASEPTPRAPVSKTDGGKIVPIRKSGTAPSV